MTRPNSSQMLTALTTLALTTTVAASALAAPVAVAAGSAGTHLLSCTGSKLTRPQGSVVLSCGDGNIVIRGTHWSSWTSTAAVGTTTLEANLCNPNCAQSKMRSYPDSRVRLSDAKHSSAGVVFTRATITYKNHGKDATVTAYPRT